MKDCVQQLKDIIDIRDGFKQCSILYSEDNWRWFALIDFNPFTQWKQQTKCTIIFYNVWINILLIYYWPKY